MCLENWTFQYMCCMIFATPFQRKITLWRSCARIYLCPVCFVWTKDFSSFQYSPKCQISKYIIRLQPYLEASSICSHDPPHRPDRAESTLQGEGYDKMHNFLFFISKNGLLELCQKLHFSTRWKVFNFRSLSVPKEVKNQKNPSFECEYRIFILFLLFKIKVTLQKEIGKIMNKEAMKAKVLYILTGEIILKLI